MKINIVSLYFDTDNGVIYCIINNVKNSVKKVEESNGIHELKSQWLPSSYFNSLTITVW